jgi:hypothetical protein
MGPPSGFVVFQRLVDETAHTILLIRDVFGRIHRDELILVHDLVVLRQDT